ncbi:restriction endonuclease subunit S [Lactobacillus crispatus]|uniref:restriction endonuclease subunit S n=1 Tax=Lactobacillus crispatus TaxID=47770 RepID=UPI0039F737B1
MTKNDDKRVPVLRFKGFNDDWAQRLLKHFITVSSQKNLDNSFDKFDVLSVSGKYGIVNQIKFQGRSLAGKTLTNYKVVNTNDVVYTKSPIKNNPYGVIKVNKHKSGIVSTLYAVYNPTKYVCSNFVELYFNDNLRLNKYLKPIVNIGAKHDMKIANKEVINHNVIFPEVEEQRQICTLFLKLEKLISLQQRKLQQLKLLKKAMLQDLFTDKNVPKLRFNGFDANWIQCKLEKEALLTMGQSPSGSTYSDQPSTYILVQGNADLKNGWVKPRIWTTQITKLAKKGDIIITVRAPAGKVGRTNFDVVLGRGVASIQGNDFIFYLLSKMDMNKYWKKYAAGSTFESINSNDIKNTRVHVPNLPEQNRIANLFLRLDDLIRFQQNKLNNLQKNKQFLLQNMFI